MYVQTKVELMTVGCRRIGAAFGSTLGEQQQQPRVKDNTRGLGIFSWVAREAEPISVIGVRLRASVEPLRRVMLWCSRGFQRALNRASMSLRGGSCRTPGRCRICTWRDVTVYQFLMRHDCACMIYETQCREGIAKHSKIVLNVVLYWCKVLRDMA